MPKDYLTQNLIGHFHYMLGITCERRDWPRARREFARGDAASAPHNDVLFYNLGLIFGATGCSTRRSRPSGARREINPRPVAGPGRLKASDRVAPLERERRRIAALEADLVADDRLSDVAPRSPGWHRRMAELLGMRGERAAARGHELRALEAEVRR